MKASALPPIEVHVDDHKITITDPLTGVCKSFNPQKIKNSHKALHGLWLTAYGNQKEGGEK